MDQNVGVYELPSMDNRVSSELNPTSNLSIEFDLLSRATIKHKLQNF
jgi:hypothetical protein